MVDTVEAQLKRMELLLNLVKEVSARGTLEEMLRTIVAVSAEETGADRGTLFLNDELTGELYSRFAQGLTTREIRILNNSGIAGHVFTSGIAEIVIDPYNDLRFNNKIDLETGYTTKSVLCVPVRTVTGDVIGVLQMLNKKKGEFLEEDLRLLEDITSLTSMALSSRQFAERMHQVRMQEKDFLDVVADVTSDIDLGKMLVKVVTEAARMLEADRATLFLHDEKSNELFSRVAAPCWPILMF